MIGDSLHGHQHGGAAQRDEVVVLPEVPVHLGECAGPYPRGGRFLRKRAECLGVPRFREGSRGCGAALELLDETVQATEGAGKADVVGVVAGFDDPAVPDTDDEDARKREGLAGSHPGVSELEDD